MRYKVEETFCEYIRKRIKDEKLISVAKENLQEILDFRFPEYDGLDFASSFNNMTVNELKRNNYEVKGLFYNNYWHGTFTVTDNGGYEMMPLEGVCPSIRCAKTNFNFGDKQTNYVIIYHYGDDMIVLNSQYITRGKEFVNKVLSIAIYTNNKSSKIDFRLVPDHYVSLMNDKIDKAGISIKNIPSLRVFANRCCDNYHKMYTDIYEPKRHK